MSDLKRAMRRPISKAGQNLVFILWTYSLLLEEYSNNPSNPNLTAWLQSGAVDAIVAIEEELAELYY